MRRLDGPKLLALGLALVFAAFWIWYGGRGEPLRADEVDALLAEIRANLERPDPELLESLGEIVRDDDGREFVMVNLIQLRERAVYPEGYDFDGDLDAAARRYARGILPELFRRASHPFFLAVPQGRFLHPDGVEDWDQVALVRYRSRRDFLEMVAALSSRDVVVHKDAYVARTQVFPAAPRISFVTVRAGVAVALALLGLGLHRLLRRVPAYRG